MPAETQEINTEPLTDVTVSFKPLRPNPVDTSGRAIDTSVASGTTIFALAAGEIITPEILSVQIPTPLIILTYVFGAIVYLRILGDFLNLATRQQESSDIRPLPTLERNTIVDIRPQSQ